MTTTSFYWHDYETFGIDPVLDRPSQFAGVRTDTEFNPIEKPLVIYCRLAADSLPHPEACLITGITPQTVEQHGVCEAEFIAQIHEQMSRPNTCSLGYNTLRFDDEVTRNCLYRNFYDPYAREWQNGNSRWDLIDTVRAAQALRPEGIQWPVTQSSTPNESPLPCFRLDQLTIANGIMHEAAHDALSDVYATLGIAQLLHRVQPKLYQFLQTHRFKQEASALLQLGSFKPVVHVSSKYPARNHCLAIVLPICQHPTNANGIIVYDLSYDPKPLLSLSAEDIKYRLYTPSKALLDGETRVPLKTVHINKCPVLAPINVIRAEDATRLAIDLDLCYARIAIIKAAVGLCEKITAVFSFPSETTDSIDPDLAIYRGGFFTDADKQKMAKIRTSTPDQLARSRFTFTDSRLAEMLFRYRARNYPETLSQTEATQWREFCVKRLTGEVKGAGITLENYFARLAVLKATEPVDLEMIEALDAYGRDKMQCLKMNRGFEY